MYFIYIFWVFLYKFYGKCFIKYNIIWIRYDIVCYFIEKFLNVKFLNLILFLFMNILWFMNILYICNYIYEYIMCESKKGEILYRICIFVRDKFI